MCQKHILIADDEENLLNSLEYILSSKGYKVSIAENGRKAFQIITQTQNSGDSIDLLITDIQMPDMSGLELIEAIHKENITIPILVLTGFGNKELLIDCLRLGCNDYLDKPVSWKELTNRVKTLLKKSETEQEKWLRTEKLAAIGVVAGEVVHDFNNMLSVTSGYADLAADKCEVGSSVLNDLEKIRTASSRAAGLANTLLTCIRKDEDDIVTTDVNQAVDTIEDLLTCLAGKRVTLTVRYAENIGLLRARAGSIERILTNLVSNARDAMPDGGTITVQTGATYINGNDVKSIPNAHPGAYALLAVSDTGTGMNKETVTKIFNPFFTTKGKEKGTGLGLSVVKKIVKGLNGWIQVDSKPGKGTSFTVYLPVVNARNLPKSNKR